MELGQYCAQAFNQIPKLRNEPPHRTWSTETIGRFSAAIRLNRLPKSFGQWLVSGLGVVPMAREYHPQLCIVTRATMSEAASERVSIVLESAQIAALFITPHGHTRLEAAMVKPFVDVAHEKGIAALIQGDARLARTLRADGVHLPWGVDAAKQYAEARQITGQRYIVGVDAGRSRHDAMSLGEAGADYVGFGIPAHVEDGTTARRHQLELVEWWSEIFEVPCVAFDVDTLEVAVTLARAGADFVALAIPADVATEHLGRWAQDLAAALDFQEVAA